MSEVTYGEPAGFVAGDTVVWKKKPPAGFEPPAWKLRYALMYASATVHFEASEANGEFVVTIEPSLSKLAPAGEATWISFLENSDQSNRHQYERGTFQIQPDYLNLRGPYDARSPDRIALENIIAVMSKKATSDQASYTIGGRSLSRFSWKELQEARADFEQRVAKEDADARVADGGGAGNKVVTEFSNA